MNPTPEFWMNQAICLAVENVQSGRGGPFGAVIVKNGACIAQGTNIVTASQDPTAHAEIVAIRAACRALQNFQLVDCDIYTSCEPCPMCLGAIYWARPAAYYFSATRDIAAEAGFDDAFIYNQLAVPFAERKLPARHLLPEAGPRPFLEWKRQLKKTPY